MPTESVARNGWNTGAAIAGGFAAGAIVGSALAAPRYAAPPPRYNYAPPPRYVAPAPVYYRPQPWTPAWYQYCSGKYRSFNPNTGYYLAYSGNYRFCQ
ncbi:BA14K family protein [Roseibium sp. RKSG952]|uniref:BA14K family protein n=1 Tax=Roseibium sp. RKSG952 TaxID=2529384 RepID=UPI001FCBEFE7|nr:BA14K family protein [Roseibium sp. RKSG952]